MMKRSLTFAVALAVLSGVAMAHDASQLPCETYDKRSRTLWTAQIPTHIRVRGDEEYKRFKYKAIVFCVDDRKRFLLLSSNASSRKLTIARVVYRRSNKSVNEFPFAGAEKPTSFYSVSFVAVVESSSAYEPISNNDIVSFNLISEKTTSIGENTATEKSILLLTPPSDRASKYEVEHFR